MDRTLTPRGRRRGAGPALAAVVASVLVVTACSGDSEPEDSAAPSDDAAAETEPEPARFSSLPNACRTLTEDTIAEVVPEAGEEQGEELPSDDVDATSICLWSGLDGYDFRSLTVTLKRFDSDNALGSGDDRATQYLLAQSAEITDNEANEDLVEHDESGIGEESVSLSYAAEKESGDSTREFQQQRVIARSANAVVIVDYAGTGFEDADLPSAEEIQAAAEQITGESLSAVEAHDAENGEDGDDEDQDADDDGDDD